MKRCTSALDRETELERFGESFKLYECNFGACRRMTLYGVKALPDEHPMSNLAYSLLTTYSPLLILVQRDAELGKSC